MKLFLYQCPICKLQSSTIEFQRQHYQIHRAGPFNRIKKYLRRDLQEGLEYLSPGKWGTVDLNKKLEEKLCG